MSRFKFEALRQDFGNGITPMHSLRSNQSTLIEAWTEHKIHGYHANSCSRCHITLLSKIWYQVWSLVTQSRRCAICGFHLITGELDCQFAFAHTSNAGPKFSYVRGYLNAAWIIRQSSEAPGNPIFGSMRPLFTFLLHNIQIRCLTEKFLTLAISRRLFSPNVQPFQMVYYGQPPQTAPLV
jgi:hypothetical protein